MQGLMVGDSEGGRVRSYEEVCAVRVPASTRTYTPVANKDLIEIVSNTIQSVYGVENDDLELSLAMSGKDQQMFGTMAIHSKALTSLEFGSSAMVAFRNSYNKSISVALSSGANAAVCSNKQIFGEIIELRKHTTNVWNDIRDMIRRAIEAAAGNFRGAMNELRQLKAVPLTMDDCFQLVGLAQGHGVLRAQQASVVYSELKEPSHEEFADVNAYSLYNHFTEGLKRSPAFEAMNRHQKVTKFFSREFGTTPLQQATVLN